MYLISPGVSGFHQHLTLLIAIPLGVLAGGVAVHVVVMVSALNCWGVLYQDVFIFQIFKFSIFCVTLRQAISSLCMWDREQLDQTVSP